MMLLVGLWHGPSWNFVIFGAIHGVALAIHKVWTVWKPLAKMQDRPAWRAVVAAFSHLLTLGVVFVASIFFRAATIPEAMDYLARLLSWTHTGTRLNSPFLLVASSLWSRRTCSSARIAIWLWSCRRCPCPANRRLFQPAAVARPARGDRRLAVYLFQVLARHAVQRIEAKPWQRLFRAPRPPPRASRRLRHPVPCQSDPRLGYEEKLSFEIFEADFDQLDRQILDPVSSYTIPTRNTSFFTCRPRSCWSILPPPTRKPAINSPVGPLLRSKIGRPGDRPGDRPGQRRAQARLRQRRRRQQRQSQPRARAPLPRPSLRRDLQDHHGDHHGLHADPDALSRGYAPGPGTSNEAEATGLAPGGSDDVLDLVTDELVVSDTHDRDIPPGSSTERAYLSRPLPSSALQ